jgi:diguanylate cyclase (GGDEF)-like protein/PAS domain S-box-containing protein
MSNPESIKLSEDEHSDLIDNMMSGLVVHAPDGRVLRCNAMACQLLGLTQEQIQGKALIDPSWRFLRSDGSVMPTEEYPVSRVLASRESFSDKVIGVLHSDRSDPVWLHGRGDPVFHPDGTLKQVVIIFMDITRIRRVEVDLGVSENRYRLLFENSLDAVLETEPGGRITAANAAACRMFGMTAMQLCAAERANLMDLSDPRLTALLQERADNGTARGELTMIRANGERFEAEVSSSLYADHLGKTTAGIVVRDVSQRIRAQRALEEAVGEMVRTNAQLEHIAHYDVLTSLPNRALLADRLQQSIAQSQRRQQSLAVAFLDLDGFKAVNDHHGHAVGDQLLVSLAHRMKQALREGDTLARFGGDEFVAVLGDLEQGSDSEPVLQRLLDASSSPVLVGKVLLQLSASIGVTVYPQDGSDADQLLRHADQAMYLAKQSGKNRYHLFDVVQDTAVKSRQESLDRLGRALDDDEFVLFYQPKVDMQSGEIVGLEALIRWQHPERGLLPPGEFLPSIEGQALAVRLGEWVIETALCQLAQWLGAGLALAVSVNIDAYQLQQSDFVQRLCGLLNQYPEVKPGDLELEILETSALEDVSKVSKVIHACRALGVRFAIDDFGTGYSSLTYLKHLPAEQLKIDQSFVRDMLQDQDDLGIVRGVIGLAGAFNRQVIAEGVETAAHGAALLAMGCSMVQGFGIARPMPASDIPAWVARWRTKATWAA